MCGQNRSDGVGGFGGGGAELQGTSTRYYDEAVIVHPVAAGLSLHPLYPPHPCLQLCPKPPGAL